MSIEKTVARLLMARHKRLAIAESCTGGLLTHRLTNISGSSKFLEAAVVAYSNKAKQKLLNIPSRMLRQHGAVSKHTAAAMARSVRAIHKTDLGIGITGIAGPGGATKTKPAGLVYIALSVPAETLCLQCRFKGDRINIKQKAVTQALRLLKECLSY
ncbi:MAG: CinA family protein [Candidatus Omnitrophica bacterium]|nr:CinA family protein [Candidatus Omnitrophota bacterium]